MLNGSRVRFNGDFNLIFYGALFSIPLVMLMVRNSTARAPAG